GTRTVGGGGGAGTVTFSGNLTVAAGTTLAASRAITVSSGAVAVNGAFQLNQNGALTAGSMSYGSGAALIFAHSSGTVGIATSSAFWPASSGPTDVAIQGAGGISFASGVARTVPGTFRTAGPVANAQRLTVNGTLELDAGGSVSGNPTYGAAATLDYESGTFVVGGEWGTGAVVGVGVPRDLTIDAGGGSVALPSSDRYLAGRLTIASGTL